MARVCTVTGRRKRTWKSYVQKVIILVNGKPKKVYVSARALKSGKVERVY